MKWLLLTVALWSLDAHAADWLIASPSGQADAGARFEVEVAGPFGAPLPDALQARVKIDAAELLITLDALSPEVEGRRVYAGTMPGVAAGAVTLELVGHDSNALVIVVARRSEMQKLTGRAGALDEPPLSEEEPVYFVMGGHDGWDARFQLSFKYRLFDQAGGFGAEAPWLVGFYFGYTQTSFWDLSAQSKPFRDTSYRPSFFWKWDRTDAQTWIDSARFGFEHESNGQAGDESRSINTLFVRPEWRWATGDGGEVEFTPKAYVYLNRDENFDIQQYRGFTDWRVRHDSGGLWITTAVARLGTAGKASLLLDMSRRMRDMKVGPLSGYLHLQYFNGWGESILDYNVRSWNVRVGLAIVP
jgi:phospholipase A1/A2